MADRKLKIDVVVDEKGAVRKLNRVESEIKDVGQAATKSGASVGQMVAAFGGVAVAAAAVAGLSRAFRFAVGAAFDMNATLETSTLQFETLMGDADRAKAHVAGLFEFAKLTPFETGPIIEASRLMQTFGGDALNTTANLTLIGDAAAGAGVPINELGFWTGRLVANLQGGRPFGEAAARLTELAVLSPQARTKMEDLAKAGATGDEIFSVFQETLGKFTGSMVKQAGTWDGVVSTFKDTVDILLGEAFKPLFEQTRNGLSEMNDLLSSEGVAGAIEQFATVAKENLPGVGELFVHVAKAAIVLADTVNVVQGVWNAFQSGFFRILASLEGGINKLLRVNLAAIDAFERILPGSILQSSDAYLELRLMIEATAQAQQVFTDKADKHAAQFDRNARIIDAAKTALGALASSYANASTAADGLTASEKALVDGSPAVVAANDSVFDSLDRMSAGLVRTSVLLDGVAARLSAMAPTDGPRSVIGSSVDTRHETSVSRGRAASDTAIPVTIPWGGFSTDGVFEQTRIPNPFPTAGAGGIAVTVNAQGAVFENDRALQRLADKISRLMATGSRLGALSG